ncbi:MAG: AMP-binding protein [Endozoicomonadaceae bacterium]|nr:AMP-binding protein [Endozoicomonadaceae bacterium]MCY4329897.1 AMP-binding protein [Endozoicomonadaceae bacterium]
MDSSFWHGKRAPGIKDKVDLNTYTNLIDFLNKITALYADKPAFKNMGTSLSFIEVDQLSTRFATYLQSKIDLKPGDRVAVQLPNTLQSPVIIYGLLKAGMILVNINPLYTEREMKEQLIDSGAKALIFLDVFGYKVSSVVAEIDLKHLIVTSLGDLFSKPKQIIVNIVVKYIKKMVQPFSLPGVVTFKEAIKEGKSLPFKPFNAKPEDIAVIQYTGGTTGRSKGAILTHHNLLSNVLQCRAGLSQVDENAKQYLQPGQESVIAALPLYHIYAFTIHLMMFFGIGATNILITNPRDIAAFIKVLKKNPPTVFVGLNTLFAALLHHKDIDRCDLTSLKLTTSGGTALTKEVATRWKEKTGCQISEAYGLTECSPVVSMNPMGKEARQGTVGMALPETALKVIDSESGKELPLGEPGELCIKGPQVMQGYWHKPEETANVFDDQGWLKSGDIAVINQDGFVKIVDRIKDMVLVSGFNVYPNEVEEVVSLHPEVISCAVTGIPDKKSGEAIKLFVVPKSKTLTEQALKTYCKKYLTGYKVPRYIEFRESLPMTPVGKVLRRQLREEHEQKVNSNE